MTPPPANNVGNNEKLSTCIVLGSLLYGSSLTENNDHEIFKLSIASPFVKTGYVVKSINVFKIRTDAIQHMSPRVSDDKLKFKSCQSISIIKINILGKLTKVAVIGFMLLEYK